jgi:hypothetical protein
MIRAARPLLKEASLEQQLRFLQLVREATFFKLGKKLPAQQPEPEEEPEEPSLGYEHFFKPKEQPAPIPKHFQGWDDYEKNKDVEEEVLPEDYLDEK